MKKYKLVVAGTRGIPNILGGIETHCEELYPRIAEISSIEIILVRRKTYVKDKLSSKKYKKIILKDIFTPKLKSFEAIVHTFLSVIYSKIISADIIHIHGIGPGLLVPFARILGLKVVFTNHGPDYDRQKWGQLAKFFLKLGEKLSYKYSHKVIVISDVIKSNLLDLYGKKNISLIHNGVNFPNISKNQEYIESLNLEKNKYIFTLGRFVEEKGFHDLIEAYKKINFKGLKLVIAGDADHETEYSQKLKKTAVNNDVILTGFIKGEKLNQLFTNTKLFVLPSYHEGLPISLLEALSYNANILVSDIPANLEVGLPKDCYFNVGNIDSLVKMIQLCFEKKEKNSFDEKIKKEYNWDNIAYDTHELYKGFID